MKKNSSIFVAGHSGLVGSSILEYLKKKNYSNVYFIDKKKLDLRRQNDVYDFFLKKRFEYVIDAAGKVGGILANNIYRGEFLYDNLMIQSNIIHASFLSKVKSLIIIASSSIYPKKNNQIFKESDLLTGSLEQTNEPYTIAKIAGIKMCENYNIQYGTNYKCLVPCNLYGPNDNYNKSNSHFFPALINKIYLAKIKKNPSVYLWGDGRPKREIMFVRDVANACLFFLKKKTKHSLINIGTGNEKTILQFAKIISKKIGYKGNFKFDKTKPNGVKRKLLDCGLAKKYGWSAKTILDRGLGITIKDFERKIKSY